MSRHPLLGALVAASAAGAAMRARPRLPDAQRRRWERTNHAGRTVTLLEGPVYAVAAATGAFAAGRPWGPGLVAALGAGGFGALDDLAGDSSSKGLAGHLGALARGEVTTGAVKIVGLGATGLAAAVLADRRTGRGLLASVVGGAAIAGSANLANLFDLRPGRTLKVVAIGALPLLVPANARGAATAAAALGAAAGTLPADLHGESMLGDTGANAAGALVGLALVERTGLRGRLALLAVSAGLTVLSERVSFSKVIEDHEVLRRLDRWGRA
jgi:UDP-N-acetylmuramyl pentapeptide phosphotransferase/UDP-N-acetylglucosamine-1-phosphate transferase